MLIKRKYPPCQHWLSFPGGKVEKAETPRAAAKRELYEETGLLATCLEYLATFNLAKEMESDASYFLSVYHALDIRGTAKAADDALSLHWLTLTEMKKEQVIPSVYAIAEQLEQQSGKCEAFSEQSADRQGN